MATLTVREGPALSLPPRPRQTPWLIVRRAVTFNPLTVAGSVLVAIFLVVAVVGPLITSNPLLQTSDILSTPSASHLFGTDNLGRDLLARSAAGARISLLVALASVAMGLLVALPLGMIAGYFATSWVDEVIMRGVDIILSLPLFILALVVLGFYGSGAIRVGPIVIPGLVKVVGLIALAAVPLFARVARAATMVERQEDYVDALRVIGVSRFRILFGEILVNVLPPVMIQAFIWMAVAVFAEAALSFLGLGIQPPNPTLGNILLESRNYMLAGAWWFPVFPGLLLFAVIVGFNLLGDGLSDLLDPSLRA
jgi:ABC-type dipeptide/oligopeptide/nickel transport system permease subunit